MKSSRFQINRSKARRGSTMVESTLCFLGFMFLSLGLMEFSMAVYAYNFVSYAARDAARYASVHGSHSSTPVTADALKTKVRSEAIALTSSNVNVTTTWSPNNTPGSEVKVVVSYTVVPLINLALRNSFQVSSTSRMRIAN